MSNNKANMITADSILYFPSIEFKSPEWVKASLLVWDRIYRIVPKSYEPMDSDEVREAVDADLIRSIRLEEQDLKKTADSFLEFYKNLEYIPAGLEDDYKERVHADKVDKRLYPILEKLATRFEGDWFHLSPDLARGYMFYLSQSVAERRNLARATDSRDAWTVSAFFSEEGNISECVYDTSTQGQFCHVNINDLIPLSVGCTPMKKVVNFVQKRSDEKKEFRQVVSEFLDKLAACDSNEHTQFLVRDFKKSLIEKKIKLRRSMDFCSPEDLSSFFAVGVPVSLTALGTLATLSSEVSLQGFFSSLLIGSVAAYADFRRVQRHNRGGHLASYLIDLDETLAAEQLMPNFRYIMDQFIND